MTLGDGKRKVYELLDEYGADGGVDAELAQRMPDFFDMAQKELSRRCRLVRCAALARAAGRTEYAMPADFAALRRIWRDGEPRTARYRWKGAKLVVPAADAGTIEIEYYALPATIGPATPDSYEFEIAEAAQQAMPFFVAAMSLSADLVQDAGVLMGIYRMMAQDLPAEPAGSARVRCALFGR